jgi:hypothetical protein
MKFLNLRLPAFVEILFVLTAICGESSILWGQETEPNNPCSNAQDFGAVTLTPPFTVNGSLDSTVAPDLDFFKFTATPGTPITVDLKGDITRGSPLSDPLLGLFDAECNLITSNDDRFDLNSRLIFTVPDSGVFILAATSYPDFEFASGGFGDYRMTAGIILSVGSISGRIVDAINGDSLPGDTEPFAFVTLLRCGESCIEVNNQPADGQGRFQFSVDFSGAPLEVGTYQVVSFANQYQEGRSAFFEVAEGQHLDIGEVGLQPFPVQFSDTIPCDNLPPEGGKCRYTVRVRNGMGTVLTGEAWSLVSASGIGSFTDFTNFQVRYLKPLTLESNESRNISFEFNVPSRVREGATICTSVYIGQHTPNDQRLDVLFNTVGQRDLFCVTKEATGLTMVPQKKAQHMLRQLSGRNLTPLRKHR